MDRVRIEYVSEPVENCSTFLFTNFFGYPESMTFTGTPVEAVEMESVSGYLGGELQKYDERVMVRTSINSGGINEETFALFQDLIHSPSVYAVAPVPTDGTKAELKKIVVENIDVRRMRISKNLQTVSFDYVYAETERRDAYINSTFDEEIFDESFDESFE